ncbi:hypothetical protein CHARACLAT_028777 [Characodon lateralis]|uniref:Uncharacterized protein n=1 Tax=Characodon lateralis TaxID=208331 RepID=A0ABU7F7I7_9TELE|nr:hypothetical protein [Characodon lateralis]
MDQLQAYQDMDVQLNWTRRVLIREAAERPMITLEELQGSTAQLQMHLEGMYEDLDTELSHGEIPAVRSSTAVRLRPALLSFFSELLFEKASVIIGLLEVEGHKKALYRSIHSCQRQEPEQVAPPGADTVDSLTRSLISALTTAHYPLKRLSEIQHAARNKQGVTAGGVPSPSQTPSRRQPYWNKSTLFTEDLARGLILSIIVGTERRMAATHVIVLREQSLCQSEKSWLLCSTFPHKETTDSPCQSPDW